MYQMLVLGVSMPDSPLAKKLRLKPGQQIALINAPSGYLAGLSPLPKGVSVSQKLVGVFDWVQIFVGSQAKLEALIVPAFKALKPDATLWISFPKGSSKTQTDLTRDKGWDSLRGLDLKWTNLVSVNETCSAFSVRPYEPGEPRQSFL
jgi:hypothetical protein